MERTHIVNMRREKPWKGTLGLALAELMSSPINKNVLLNLATTPGPSCTDPV